MNQCPRIWSATVSIQVLLKGRWHQGLPCHALAKGSYPSKGTSSWFDSQTLVLVAVVAKLGLVMEAIDQWFPKFIQQVAPLTYWTIDCGSPLGLQSYILCRAEDFCKDSEAGRFPWFPSKPHLTVCHRGSNIWLCPRTLCNLPMELLERMLLQSQEKLLFI